MFVLSYLITRHSIHTMYDHIFLTYLCKRNSMIVAILQISILKLVDWILNSFDNFEIDNSNIYDKTLPSEFRRNIVSIFKNIGDLEHPELRRSAAWRCDFFTNKWRCISRF